MGASLPVSPKLLGGLRQITGMVGGYGFEPQTLSV